MLFITNYENISHRNEYYFSLSGTKDGKAQLLGISAKYTHKLQQMWLSMC